MCHCHANTDEWKSGLKRDRIMQWMNVFIFFKSFFFFFLLYSAFSIRFQKWQRSQQRGNMNEAQPEKVNRNHWMEWNGSKRQQYDKLCQANILILIVEIGAKPKTQTPCALFIVYLRFFFYLSPPGWLIFFFIRSDGKFIWTMIRPCFFHEIEKTSKLNLSLRYSNTKFSRMKSLR